MLGTFASTSNLVFMALCVRVGGGVVHPLIGRYGTGFKLTHELEASTSWGGIMPMALITFT